MLFWTIKDQTKGSLYTRDFTPKVIAILGGTSVTTVDVFHQNTKRSAVSQLASDQSKIFKNKSNKE